MPDNRSAQSPLSDPDNQTSEEREQSTTMPFIPPTRADDSLVDPGNGASPQRQALAGRNTDLPNLDWREMRRGALPGNRYVRVLRSTERPFPEVAPAHLRADEMDLQPQSSGGQFFRRAKRVLIGRPIPSENAIHERLTKVKALAILSSDAISSVAYGPEAALLVLAGVGAGALQFNIPIVIAITLLLAIVTMSYRQTIFGYPSGGGSYIVASDNLGPIPGLIAAAALLIDYILTVAVSIASGVAALTSAAPGLLPYSVVLGLGFILLVTLGNLRGIRESGSIFSAPTYLFIVALLALVAIGLVKVFILHDPLANAVPRIGVPGGEQLGIVLILKAFSSGCSAMTGVEAVSNGVPAFKPPEARNAATTMLWMSGILGILLLGITVLGYKYGTVPNPASNPTVLSQLAEAIIGHGFFYYVIQGATLAVLVLAANTSYADFPRLASILARDRYAPHQFAFRGDRLAFTVGIVFLALVSSLLLVLFKGNTDALIPLYAVGVFVSFTMSQAGMVVHWYRLRGPGWAVKAIINGVGAVATALVALVSGATKFFSGEALFQIAGHSVHAGSWIVIVLVPIIVMIFLTIARHYREVQEELELPVGEALERPLPSEQIVIVPIASVNRAAVNALNYALALSNRVVAVHVTDNAEEAVQLEEKWQTWGEGANLVILESPYRSLAAPLLSYIDLIHRKEPQAVLTVLVPEYIPGHWWAQLLHAQTALRLKAALLFRPNIIVTSIPYHGKGARERATR